MSDMRVYYNEQQVLRATDLMDEQAYLSGLRRRHAITGHGWGVAKGLEVIVEGQDLVLAPGIAIDGYGRELIVPAQIRIGLPKVDPGAEIALDVWLVYSLNARLDTGAKECRIDEQAVLCLTIAPDDASVKPKCYYRRPAQVPETDLPFPPYRPSPTDSTRRWPVFLERVTFNKQQWSTPTVPSARPCVTLVGASIYSASRAELTPANKTMPEAPDYVPAVRLELAKELGAGKRRLSLRLVDENGQEQERMALDYPGVNTLRGHMICSAARSSSQAGDASVGINGNGEGRLTLVSGMAGVQPQANSDVETYVHANPLPGLSNEERTAWANAPVDLLLRMGDLHLIEPPPAGWRRETWLLLHQPRDTRNVGLLKQLMAEDLRADWASRQGDGPDSSCTLQLVRRIEPPKIAYPWRIYTTELKPDETAAQQSETTIRQLRIELGTPGEKGDPHASRLVVGYNDGKDFQPCLTVDAAGNVTVEGCLYVTGDLVQPPIPADPTDPRFTELLVQEWIQAGGAVGVLNVNIVFDQKQARAGQMWSYTLTVKNLGSITVHSVELSERVTIAGAQPTSQLLATMQELKPGESRVIPVRHDALNANARGTISVTASAIAGPPTDSLVLPGSINGDLQIAP